MDEKSDESADQHRGAVESLREWVSYHKLRMCTVDVVAWSCFALGVVRVLGAEQKGA